MATWRTPAFRVLRHTARAFELVSRGLVHVAAGVLRPEQLREVMMERWQRFGTTDDFVDSGLLPWEATLYPRFLRRDDDVLLIGCGTGRDLVALLRAGYRVEGLEPAAAAAAMARTALLERGLDAPVAIGRIETAPLTKSWDAVIFSWYAYTYVIGRAARVAALSRVGRHLRPGGRILVSYLPADGRPRRLPRAITASVARVARSGWSPEATDVIENEGGLRYEHQFQPGEFEDEVRAAGLAVLFHEVDVDGRAVLGGPA